MTRRSGVNARVFTGCSALLQRHVHCEHHPIVKSFPLRVLGLVLALTTAACAGGARGCSFVPGYGANGELGRGQFTYACTSDDQACVQSGDADAIRIPYAVAEGATFHLGYLPHEGAMPVALAALGRLEPATGAFVRGERGGFLAQRVGTEAIFVRAASASVEPVVDVVHVRVQAPTRVRFLVRDAVITLWRGQTEPLVAVVEGDRLPERKRDDRALLAGIVAKTSSANENVVAVERLAHGAMRLVATGLGETTVTATYGSLSATLPVRVVPGRRFTRDADAPGPGVGDTDEGTRTHAALD